MRKKNRKLRRLRELYPGLRIKLLYARDFRALLLKYGRIALADALSGAEGQSTPPRRQSAPRPDPSAASPAGERTSVPGRASEAAVRVSRPRRSRRSRSEARARAVARASAIALGTEITA